MYQSHPISDFSPNETVVLTTNRVRLHTAPPHTYICCKRLSRVKETSTGAFFYMLRQHVSETTDSDQRRRSAETYICMRRSCVQARSSVPKNLFLLQFFTSQHLISLQIFINRLIHDLLRQCPVIIRICFQPVSSKLLIK